MTRTISLIIGIAVAALGLTASAAFGKPVDPQHAVAYFYANERATMSLDGNPGRALVFDNYRSQVAPPSSANPPVFDNHKAEPAPATGSSIVFDNYRMDPQPVTTPVVASTGTGDSIEWPQLGIGVGIGIALALGLLLALRSTRQRPLAH
jgi:hypothetical protein